MSGTIAVTGPEYPKVASALALAGGLLVAVVGGVELTAFSSVDPLASQIPGWLGVGLASGGIATGAAIVALSLALRYRPHRYAIWGGLLILLAIVSLIVAAGGLFVGFVLAMVGGIAALVWTPSWERPANPPTEPAPP